MSARQLFVWQCTESPPQPRRNAVIMKKSEKSQVSEILNIPTVISRIPLIIPNNNDVSNGGKSNFSEILVMTEKSKIYAHTERIDLNDEKTASVKAKEKEGIAVFVGTSQELAFFSGEKIRRRMPVVTAEIT